MKEKYFEVDGWLTAQDGPRIQLEERNGRKHTLTLPQVRGLMSDIFAEIQRLDEERNDNGDDNTLS